MWCVQSINLSYTEDLIWVHIKQQLNRALFKFYYFITCKNINNIVYSASMKSYHFWNFDILKIIKGIFIVTLHFVFLINYRHASSNKTIPLALQLGSSCCMCILCFLRFIKMWKHLFSPKTNISVYAWKIFLENTIKMVLIFHQIEQARLKTFWNHHDLASSHRTQWKHLLFISEGYHAFMCDVHRFL